MSGAPPSQWIDLDGPVHHVDYGGPTTGPVLVCVHGLGGSLVNWAAVAPRLAETCRVLALDLAGFGRTRGGGRSTAVPANRALLDRFLAATARGPVILVGNSMGGTIAAMQTALRPDTVAGLVLIDPALPVHPQARVDPMATAMFAAFLIPGMGRAVLARRRVRGAAQVAGDMLRLCCADPSRVPADVVAQHIALAEDRRAFRRADAELLTATRSLMWTLAQRRQYAAMLRRIDRPVLLLHGDQDRLVSIAAARATATAHPSWRFEVARGVGHVPQLEVPDWTVDRILSWLDSDGAAAARSACGAPAAGP